MADTDNNPPGAGGAPDDSELLYALLRAARRIPEATLPPAKQLAWWDRGVRDGVEIGLIYAKEALRVIRLTLEAGDASLAHTFTVAFEFLFDYVDVPRREDARVERVRMIVENEGLRPPWGGANPRLPDSLTEAAAEILGDPGQIITPSRHYSHEHPGHVAVFNANVCVEPAWKVWYGDVDLTHEESRLLALAGMLERTVYVLPEQDGSCGGRDERPLIERAVYTARPDGSCAFAPLLVRGENGVLQLSRALPEPPVNGDDTGDA